MLISLCVAAEVYSLHLKLSITKETIHHACEDVSIFDGKEHGFSTYGRLTHLVMLHESDVSWEALGSKYL